MPWCEFFSKTLCGMHAGSHEMSRLVDAKKGPKPCGCPKASWSWFGISSIDGSKVQKASNIGVSRRKIPEALKDLTLPDVMEVDGTSPRFRMTMISEDQAGGFHSTSMFLDSGEPAGFHEVEFDCPSEVSPSMSVPFTQSSDILVIKGMEMEGISGYLRFLWKKIMPLGDLRDSSTCWHLRPHAGRANGDARGFALARRLRTRRPARITRRWI